MLALQLYSPQPITFTPPMGEGPQALIRAVVSSAGAACCQHFVTDARVQVVNPETGKPFRLDGQPYALSVALCGRFGEWLAAGDEPLCLICRRVMEDRGGMKPLLRAVP